MFFILAVEKWTQKWDASTSLEFLDRPAVEQDRPQIFSWMDFEPVPLELRLAIRQMVDQWDAFAQDSEVDIHTEIFNNSHPIVVSQGKVKGRPGVAWPVYRVEMNTIAHLTSKNDSRAVTTRKIDQTDGPWLSAVDRVVVADVLTDHSPTVMLVLENPFSTRFRALLGSDFVLERQKLIKDLFSWPSETVSDVKSRYYY